MYVAAVVGNQSVGGYLRDCVTFTNLDGVAFTKLGETNFLYIPPNLLAGLSVFTLRTNINIASNVWAAGFDQSVNPPDSCDIYVVGISNLVNGSLVQSRFNGSVTNGALTPLTNVLSAAPGPSSTVLVFASQAITPSGFTNATLPILGTLTIGAPSTSLTAIANTNSSATASNAVLSSSGTFWALVGMEFN